MGDAVTEYTYHVAMIVPAAKRAPASALADTHGRTSPHDTFEEFFSVALSATGTEPETHYGCHTAMRARLWDRLPNLRNALGGGEWMATRTPDGETGQSFDDLAAQMGLTRIEVET